MPFVERRNGSITALYAAAQPEVAEEWLDDNDAEVVGFLNPERPYRLYKSDFIRRLVKDETKDEAAILEHLLSEADAQLRLLFNSVEYFVSDDPLFETLKVAVGAALGSDRADALLAEETP